MSYYAYLFEAHSIQPYILSSGKLRDMVGASEMLEQLLAANGPLDMALDELGLLPKTAGVGDYECSRRGGAAFALLFNDREKALALRDLWGLMVSGVAPGLSFDHTVSDTGETPSAAFRTASHRMESLRNRHEVSLPVAGPLVRRSPRTGQPAVHKDTTRDMPEWVDEATRHKRFFSKAPSLERKFLDGSEPQPFEFPLDTDTEFPTDTTRYVGILHADGNGLGNIVRALADELKDQPMLYAPTFLTFSEQVNRATCEAAQEALRPILGDCKGKYLPFRPLVLGGDDLTVIVRADIAMQYAKDFLNAFEAKTAEYLAPLSESFKAIPQGLTACAGIAFIKINQPFAMGYRLAESLCSHAKAESKQAQGKQAMMPSALAFHRVTSSMIGSYNELLSRELTAIDGSDHYRLTLGAYGVGQHAASLPAFDDLQKLKKLFSDEKMSRGPMRHFMTLLHEGIPEAKRVYQRWQHNMQKDHDLAVLYKDYQARLGSLLPAEQHAGLPFTSVGTDRDVNIWKSFLADLSGWMAVEGETHA